MSLKLFRSTGYSSILVPGETRLAPHPFWLVLAVGAWIGFACNVPLWRELSGAGTAAQGLGHALTLGLLIAGGVIAVLSLLGWRRTVKPAASLLLLLAAGVASGLWVQSQPVDASLLHRGATALFPNWATLLTWQVPALLALLSLPPLLWLWNTSFRRLPGPRQLGVNVMGALAGAGLFGGIGLLMASGILQP